MLPAALFACACVAASVSGQTAPPGPGRAAATAAPDAAERDPAEILRAARIVHVSSGTSFFEAAQLQHELRKRADFAAWRMAAVVGDGDARRVADIEIEVDRPLFSRTFTYTVTDRRTSAVIGAGAVAGWDGHDAAPKLARQIAEEIGRARRHAPGKRNASKEVKRDSRDARAARVRS